MLGRFRALLSRFTASALLPLLVLSLLADRALSAETVKERIAIFDVNVLERRPFDRGVFTQGLAIESGKLWVSSGLYGKSFVERWDWHDGNWVDILESANPVASGKIGESFESAESPETGLDESTKEESSKKRHLELPARVFAEGLTMHRGELFLLTWKSQEMFSLDPDRLEITRSYPLPGEGWGVTSDGESLWISDGTPRIRKWRDGAFQQTLSVTLRGKPLPRLNELEWIDGEIWANVWLTDQIVIISPTTGRITGIVDLTNLLPKHERRRNTDVLNGIAQDPETGDIWVTGKRWPTMFRIELVERR